MINSRLVGSSCQEQQVDQTALNESLLKTTIKNHTNPNNSTHYTKATNRLSSGRRRLASAA